MNIEERKVVIYLIIRIKMNVLIIKSSPHKKGTTNTILETFIDAASKNNNIDIYDAGRGNIHPCLACEYCHKFNKCVQKDDGNELLEKILNSDCLVLVSPIYYFGITSQLKMVIDRFYAKNSEIMNKKLKVIYITAAWDDNDDVMAATNKHFDAINEYLNFNEIGRIMAKGAGMPSMIAEKYIAETKKIGEELR